MPLTRLPMHDLTLGYEALLDYTFCMPAYQLDSFGFPASSHLHDINTHSIRTIPYGYARARKTTNLRRHITAIHIQTPNRSQQRALGDDYRLSGYVYPIV